MTKCRDNRPQSWFESTVVLKTFSEIWLGKDQRNLQRDEKVCKVFLEGRKDIFEYCAVYGVTDSM